MFTQDEVDRLLGQRIAESKRGATKGLLDELGFSKTDDLKAAVQKMRDDEKAAMTAAERAKAEADEAKASYERQAADLAGQRHSLTVERALQAANAQGDIARLARLVEVEVGAQPEAIAAAVEATRTAFPTLFGVPVAPFAPSEPTGGGAPSRPAHSPDARTRGEERAKALNPPEKRSFIP